jgi:predicted nucleotidyltransferase
MQRSTPAGTGNLASLLFGAYRRDVLALLLLHPELSLHVREIARLTSKAPGTLLRELNLLTGAGLLVKKAVGNQVHFQANPASPVYEELRGILKKTAGVADLLREALEPLADRVRTAFVYGSVARGEERPGSDLDLMVIGDVKFADLIGALAPLHAVLRREINTSFYPPREFRAKVAAAEPFLKRVLADKKIFLVGGEDELGELAPDRKAKGARR